AEPSDLDNNEIVAMAHIPSSYRTVRGSIPAVPGHQKIAIGVTGIGSDSFNLSSSDRRHGIVLGFDNAPFVDLTGRDLDIDDHTALIADSGMLLIRPRRLWIPNSTRLTEGHNRSKNIGS